MGKKLFTLGGNSTKYGFVTVCITDLNAFLMTEPKSDIYVYDDNGNCCTLKKCEVDWNYVNMEAI